MASPDFLPAFLAVEEEPFSDDDLALYFDRADLLEADPDAFVAEEFQRPGRWRIEEDDQAEWALRKCALAAAEVRQLREQADEWAARIRLWFDQASRRPAATVAFMEDRLTDYGLRRREAGGSPTLVLPSGSIKTSERNPAVEVEDDAELARYLDTMLGEPPRAMDDAQAVAWAAWQTAWAKAVEGMDEPLEVVKRTPKVFVGPLRKLVGLAEVDDGNQAVMTLRCGHSTTWTLTDPADELDLPGIGEFVVCRTCDGQPEEPVETVSVEHLTRWAAVGPDGVEVPGASVRPAETTVKVAAR